MRDIDKVNSQSSVGRESYIDYIRAFAAVTVVLLHIVMTLPANYTVEQLGVNNSIIFNGIYMPTKWAVPCFVMITGALLLRPEKNLEVTKICNYIRRMLCVLVLFGTSFALMELIYSERIIKIQMFLKAILNVLEQKSWSHLWYIYVLIGLYVVTIPLKCAIQKMKPKEFDLLIYVLIIGNFLVPTINTLAKTDIYTFMILSEYATYFLLGYWLTTKKNILGNYTLLIAIGISLVMIFLETLSLKYNKTVFELNHQSKDIMTMIQSISMFLFLKNVCEQRNHGKLISLFSNCSFGIYIMHPFWINIIYKGLKITPLSMPIGIGIVVLFIAVLILSVGTAYVLKRLPYLKEIM